MGEARVIDGKLSFTDSPHLRWGILGCGVIANQMAEALALEGRKATGVANRTHEKAVAYAEKYGIEKVYDKIDDMFADPEIDAVYITTPHNTHITYLRKALSSGKHVLCEKSITLNSDELSEARALAKENGVVLMDATTILHMPLYQELRRRVFAGELGPVHLAQCNFGSWRPDDMSIRFFNRNLAGGAMLDIGVYAITMAIQFLDSNPTQIVSLENDAPTGVDEESGIVMRNKEGQLAVISLTLRAKQPKRAVISCHDAYIEVMEYPRADTATIVWTHTGERETVKAGKTEYALNYEMADLEDAVAGDTSKLGLIDIAADVMDDMTALRRDWGIVYPEEEQTQK